MVSDLVNDTKKIEARAYGKGYAAGRRKMERDIDEAAEREAKRRRFDQFYAAAMTGLLAAQQPWSRGDQPNKNAADYASTAAHIADAMIKRVR